MVKKHNRRPGYWKVYDKATPQEKQSIIDNTVKAVKNNPPPGADPNKPKQRGRPRKHPLEKMASIYIIATALDLTSRDVKAEVASWNLPWGGGTPDHATICRTPQDLPVSWLDSILADIAKSCIAESKSKKGMIGTDSSAAETDRYEYEERPDKKTGKIEEIKRKTYLKFHITAIIGLQIILSCRITDSNTPDVKLLPELVGILIRRFGGIFTGWLFNADRGYDSNANCRYLFSVNMIPNIKQQRPQQEGYRINRGKRFRKMAASLFDKINYKMRGLIEGIFGGLESKDHRLFCKYRRDDMRERCGIAVSIGWNLRVLNRLKCANELGLDWTAPVPKARFPRKLG